MALRALWDVTQQFQNKNGSNLTSGKIYIYYQGRTALATTYHDEDGTVVNSNPVLLDNNGRATAFADPIYSYTIVVCDYYGKKLFSQDITLHDAISTAEDVVVLGTDGTVLVDRTELPNGVQYDLSVNTDIIATKEDVSDLEDEINDKLDDIESELADKKDKQTALSFDGAATKTVKKITQNANGEMNVEFEDIDLPPEVPNVEITSPNGTIDVQSSTDVQTNTKTFTIDVNKGDVNWINARSAGTDMGIGKGITITGFIKKDGNIDIVPQYNLLPLKNEVPYLVIEELTLKTTAPEVNKCSDVQVHLFNEGISGVHAGDIVAHVRLDNSNAYTQTITIGGILYGGKTGRSHDNYNGGIYASVMNKFTDSVIESNITATVNNISVYELTSIMTQGGSGGGDGIPIFDSLQTAISGGVALHNGDIFETCGFHTSGDGGAARYLVSDTGKANGMDIVQLAEGKVAILQAGDWIIPEQLGYVQSYSRYDVVPYIKRAINIGCQHIHLISSGGKAGYTWKSKLTISVRGFKLTGEGDWGSPNKFSYVVFRPDASVTSMIDLTMRDVLISDIDFEVTGNYIKLVDGITCSTYNMDETRFWEFRNLRFNSFRKCIYLGGTVKWQNTIKDCLFNYCAIGIEIYESSTMQLLIENCQFIGCDTNDLLFNGNVLSAKMICCNFGSVDNAVAFKVNSSTYLYQNATFESCNFENDNADGHNRRAIAIDLYDPNHSGLRQNITISNCHFVIGKYSAPVQDTTNRFIRLGDSTNLVFMNNQILGHNEPEHTTWVTYPKLLWDEISLPVNGGIVCVGESISLEFPDELLPYLQRYNEASRISVSCRRNASEQGWGDCNTWLPDFDGQVKVCGVSSYDIPATQNLPIENTFGFLWVMGTISGANARVLQRYESDEGNIYTRIGRGNNGVWTWGAWKTITAT